MEYGILAAVACGAFLIGSVPTAWLLLRRQSGRDIRREGSGNVGALNAFEVSGSRGLGLAVLLIDLLKGLAAMLAVRALAGDAWIPASVALICVVAGHNYSPWIGFAGGRGLATAAGASLLFNPFFLLGWGGMWLLAFSFSRRVHVANLTATVTAPFLLLLAPERVAHAGVFAFPGFPETFAMACLLCGLIFLRHLAPLRALLRGAS